MIGTERYTFGQIDTKSGRHKEGWQVVRQEGRQTGNHAGRQGGKKRDIIVYTSGQIIRRPGVNFTNILLTTFSYESFLRSFYVLTIWVCNFLARGFGHKRFS